MKIEIEIPDFVPPERIIFIVAGIEKIGWIEPHSRRVFVKVSRCSRCGKCCAKIGCPDLEDEPGDNDLYRCGKAEMRPLLCSISDPRDIPECTSRYEMMQ